MAHHSSILAWRIPGMGEPGGLPSMGSHKVGHDWNDLAAAAACTSKVMLNILYLSFNSIWTENFQMFKLDLGKAEEQIANICWIIERARKFQKNIYFFFIDYAKTFDYVDHNKLWKILQEMGIPEHLTCLLRNLYASQEATVRTGHGTTDWFQIGKGVRQGCILLPCLFNFYAEYIMQNSGLDEAQAESRLRGEISIISDM